MFSISLLGPFTVLQDGKRFTEDLGPAGRLFASYLFQFAGRTHRRERLAEEFWGHLEPERGRAALNTALWRLKKLLARDPLGVDVPNLYSNTTEIVLEPAPWLVIDTHRFDDDARRAFGAGDLNQEVRLTCLEAAANAYRGPFLDGDDGNWVLEERERLHSLFVRVGTELFRTYARRRRYDEAISIARRILNEDVFREAVHRDLTILFVLNGQRAAALQHLERLVGLFQSELGIEPMPETLSLAREIRSSRIFDRIESLQNSYF